MTFRIVAGCFVLLSALALTWFGAHLGGSMPSSPWPMRNVDVEAASNAAVVADEGPETPDAFDEMIAASVGEHERIYRENRIAIDSALRSTAEVRAQIDARPRYVIGGDMLRSLGYWRHRVVAVLVDEDGERAFEGARLLWAHANDAVDTCRTLISCAISGVMNVEVMAAIESVVARHRGLAGMDAFVQEVRSGYVPVPKLTFAVEAEYHYARDLIEGTDCVSFDRVQTEALVREYYMKMRDYAEGGVDEAGIDAFDVGPHTIFHLCTIYVVNASRRQYGWMSRDRSSNIANASPKSHSDCKRSVEALVELA